MKTSDFVKRLAKLDPDFTGTCILEFELYEGDIRKVCKIKERQHIDWVEVEKKLLGNVNKNA